MPVLETAAAVAGITSCYIAGTNLFRTWRKDRKEAAAKKSVEEQKGVETSLVRGSTDVQTEYDGDFAKMGERFRIGDDHGRLELLTHLTNLQSSVITVLTMAMSGQLFSLGSLRFASDEARVGVLASLVQQYQRLAQAEPIQNTPSLPAADTDTDTPRATCPGEPNKIMGTYWGWHYECSSCSLRITKQECNTYYRTWKQMWACHLPSGSKKNWERFRCKECESVITKGWASMRKHIRGCEASDDDSD